MLSEYLLTILAVAFLSIVVELVLPNGQLLKYVRSVFSFILIFVLLSPIPKLLNLDFNFSEILGQSQAVDVDTNFIKSVNEKQKSDLEQSITKLLNKNGFYNFDVLITYSDDNYGQVVDKVYIDLTNLVLKNKNEHINKYTTIKDLLTKHTQITEEQIVFYG